MMFRNRFHWGTAFVLAASASLALTSCVPSPKTTYVAAAGEQVTVDWVDYPGQSGVPAAEVLVAPSAEATRAQSAAILGEIESRLTAEFGLVWEDGPREDDQRIDGDFYPGGGNGYGGESLFVTFNSLPRESLTIPTSAADWHRIMEVIGEVTRAHGMGALKVDGLDTELTAEEIQRYGSENHDEFWQWSGTAYGQSQWVYAGLIDVGRDASGKALSDMGGSVDYGWNTRSINISYGATVLPAADRASFIERVAPFAGLSQPKPTDSD
jgi:hypothetical protein